MQNIKNIILDYGNVIFMIDFEKAQQAFTQLGVGDIHAVFGHKQQSELFDDFDKGLISSAQFRDGIRALTGKFDLTDEDIDGAWNALLIGVPAGKHELLKQLKAKYRTFLLSNNNAIHYDFCMDHIKQRYGVQDNAVFFEKAYYSHLLGTRKPNADIFEFILKEHGLIPEETLFIDDSPQHLATAEMLGFQVELCTKERPLEAILADKNLL